MRRTRPSGAGHGPNRSTVLLLAVVFAGTVGILAPWSSTPTSPATTPAAPARSEPTPTADIRPRPGGAARLRPPPAAGVPSSDGHDEGHEDGHDDGHGDLAVTDGAVGDGLTVFDDTFPAVANLDSSLLAALRAAVRGAAGDRVTFRVDSGWRSARYQDQLLREAITRYGSRREAARWVADAATSPHVAGNAVDIGPVTARAWLSRHGSSYGLCQVYRNEPWHYELRPDATDRGCPPVYSDPTHDPRMQR